MDHPHRRHFGTRRALGLFALAACAVCPACHEDPARRVEEVYSLKAHPTEANREKLRALLADADSDVRATALNALVTLGAEDSPQIARGALDDPSGFVRSVAAKLLGDLRDPEAVEPLTQRLLRDEDPIVRQRAADALAEIGGDAAGAGLVSGLDDPMKAVRLAAVKGVRHLRVAAAVARLSALLLEDPEWEIRVQAAGALGAFGGEEARPVIEAAVQDGNEFVRSAASNALAELSRAPAAPPPGGDGSS